MKRPRLAYPIDRSPFYRLRSKARLAALLEVTRSDLLRIVRGSNTSGHYSEWPTEPKFPKSTHPALQHKPRNIQQPLGELRELQDRLLKLFARIELPDYLHSARKGRSYRTNAQAHQEYGAAFRIDIKRFYQSAQDRYVQNFCLDKLECSPDVAHLITEIACFRRRLPTGSPLSPLLSFFAYSSMFDELNVIARSVDARMTVYIDDVVMSGEKLSGDLIPQCMKVLKRYELIGHKVIYFSPSDIKIITGVAVGPKGLGVPNRRFRKMRALIEERNRATDLAEKLVYQRSLVGLLRESSFQNATLASR